MRGSALPGNEAELCAGPRGAQGPLCTRISRVFPGKAGRAQSRQPVCPALLGTSHQLVAAAGSGHQGQTPLGPPQPPLAAATVWDCPASLQGQPVWASGLPLSVPAVSGGRFF